MQFPGIVRNRLKIESAIMNARCFLRGAGRVRQLREVQLAVRRTEAQVNRWRDMEQVPASSPESDAFSKDLKKRGFKFVGTTIMYAHMQATGMVNDHLVRCFRYKELTVGL